MSAVQARRNLTSRMTASPGPLSNSKMAAAARGPQDTEFTEDIAADQDVLPQPSAGTDYPPLNLAASPASTESLLSRMTSGIPTTPMLDPNTGLLLTATDNAGPFPNPSDLSSMMAAFAQMLSTGLAQNAAQITASIHADLQQIGVRMDVIEQKADQAVSRINQNTDRLHDVQDQLETAFAKIDDLENRSRRYNFRVRGIPESEKEVQGTVKALIRSLLPDISEIRLELDRAHRALQPPRSDGLPRDIIVKPHYYSVKEEVMKKSRSSDSLIFQGHKIQIFADLSPFTIQKRRSLKPLLQVLTEKEITYRWSFPLRLNFSYRNKSYGFSSLVEGERLLLHLGILSQEPSPMQISRNTPSSSKRPPPASPLQHNWLTQSSKRPKENLPP